MTQAARGTFVVSTRRLLSNGMDRRTHIIVKASREDLVVLKDLIEAGKVAPVIDRRFALSQVPEAIRYLENEHARGKIVIAVA